MKTTTDFHKTTLVVLGVLPLKPLSLLHEKTTTPYYMYISA